MRILAVLQKVLDRHNQTPSELAANIKFGTEGVLIVLFICDA